MLKQIEEFRKRVAALPRERILELIYDQDPELVKQIQRVEWVFKNKLTHLTWADGSPIEGRDYTNEELARILDPIFVYDEELARAGFDLEAQKQVFIASDTVLWAKHYLNINPRVYQILIMRDPSNRTVLRLGRRAGKTFSLSTIALHYAYTTPQGRVLIMAPMKAHVSLIYDECMNLLEKSAIKESVVRAVASPNHEIKLSNGSTIRLFTTGMKNNAKGDVARGQEAHIIILDEMDYMGQDDLDALYAMLQKTDENQPDKRMVASSTPTGRREKFWDMCFEPDTQILTPNSTSSIQDIAIGDQVVDCVGNIDYVSNLFERQYSGEIYEFQSRGWISLRSTDKHPHLIMRDGKKFFLEANQIKVGDKLLMPVWSESEDDTESKLSDYLQYDSKYDDIYPMLDTGMTKVAIAEKLGVDRRTVFYKLEQYQKNGTFADLRRVKTVQEAHRLYIEIKNNTDHTALGLYLAEGSIIKDGDYVKGVVWTFGSNEQDLEKICIEFIHGLGLNYRVQNRSKIDNSRQIVVQSSALGILFQAIFGESEGKRVPYFIKTLEKDVVIPFIEGVLMGDASKKFEDWDTSWSLYLIAKKAIVDIWQILIENDMGAKLSRRVKVGNRRETWGIYYSPKHVIEKDAEHVYIPIDNIVTEKYDGPVYNFETIKTHTYVARNYATHNCCSPDSVFTEYYYPSYVNPFWNAETEAEMRSVYGEMGYRHEIEADWGEDAEGVYPRRFVDQATRHDWEYGLSRHTQDSFYLMGVDWDKYGAGPNIVVLEACGPTYPDTLFRNRLRVAFREEIPRSEFVLTKAVQRIIQINNEYHPKHIYIDRGYGEAQVEMLHQYALTNPASGLKRKITPVSFSETIDVRDPATKQLTKQHIKPFMVENLRHMLEEGQILIPSSDEELYLQLISYIIVRTTQSGRPVFEASGSQQDHAHDALILACLAFTQNYGDLFNLNYATRSASFMGDILSGADELTRKRIPEIDEEKGTETVIGMNLRRQGKSGRNPNRIRRSGTSSNSVRSISRKKF